jgi:hypothetical protein
MYSFFLKRLRISLKGCFVIVTLACIVLGWVGVQKLRYYRELAAVEKLQDVYGASLGRDREWKNPMPPFPIHIDDDQRYFDGLPAWDWSEVFHGRLYVPPNYCLFGWRQTSDNFLERVALDRGCVESLLDLRSLRLLEVDTTKELKQAEIPYHRFADLLSLDTDDPCLTENEIRSIAKLRQLRSLRLGDAPLTDADVSMILQEMKHLRRFYIGSPLLTDRSLESVQSLTDLQSIGFEGKGITDRGLKHLSRMRFLSTLILGDTAIRGVGFEHLAGAPVDYLSLEGSGIDDHGVSVIAEVFPNLTYLHLASTKITDACVPDLLSLKSLELLCVSHTAISENEAAKLEEFESRRTGKGEPIGKGVRSEKDRCQEPI